MENEKIILIDGNSYLHRAYHALPELTDAEGNMINAVYGFTKMLKKVIDREAPSHIFVAFDNKKPTFRHKDYCEYKANRKKTDTELIQQIPRLFRVLDALNVKYMDYEGFEADDIIATLTKLARDRNMQVTIVTADKDALQLVGDGVSVSDGMKGLVLDPGKVREKLGVDPSQVVEYLALIGDKVDNLPGVRGIGPVTARELLGKYGNLEGIYNNIGQIKESIRNKLVEHEKEAYMTRRLVRLVENIDLPISIEEGSWKGPDPDRLRKEFESLNAKNLMSDWIEADKLRGKVKSVIIFSPDDMAGFVKNCAGKTQIVLGLVSDAPSPSLLPGDLVGICLSYNGSDTAYAPLGHSYLGVPRQPAWDGIKEVLAGLLADSRVQLVSYDLKNTLKFLKANDMPRGEKAFDIITASYLLDPSGGHKSLDKIASAYLSWVPGEIPENPRDASIEDMAGIVSGRVAALFELKEILSGELKRQSMEKLYHDVELKTVRILSEMELAGIKIDREFMKNTEAEFKEELALLEKEIKDTAGQEFNINSPRELSVILFEKIGLKPVKKTKTGYSTAEEVLEILSDEHPLPAKIIEYRKLQKLLSTYVEPLPSMADARTDRVHTTFNIFGTATGRLSSSEPNLQNIPVRTSQGCRIRKAFIAGAGKVFLSADYSQIDLRVLAHISGDENLIDSFRKGEDIHAQTASRIFEVPEAEVSEELRKKAKAINFGIVYGMSSWGLSKRADMDEAESKDFIRRYFEQYPGIEKYMNETVEKARKDLYVTTILNRRRYLPEINSSNFMRRKLFERIAVNTPVQGSSADIIKLAMVDLNEEFCFNDNDVQLLLQIHDELLFEIGEDSAETAKSVIKKTMEGAYGLSVPLTVDIKTGRNWMDLGAC
ncbi:MAG: DNA polymerase I [Elusimicrobia bacterium]|nr:DNA polymerase I [Elusimicrobiota bacterium]